MTPGRAGPRGGPGSRRPHARIPGAADPRGGPPASVNPLSHLRIPPPGVSTRWYREFFRDPEWLTSLGTSVRVALLTTALALVLGVLAALGPGAARRAPPPGVHRARPGASDRPGHHDQRRPLLRGTACGSRRHDARDGGRPRADGASVRGAERRRVSPRPRSDAPTGRGGAGRLPVACVPHRDPAPDPARRGRRRRVRLHHLVRRDRHLHLPGRRGRQDAPGQDVGGHPRGDHARSRRWPRPCSWPSPSSSSGWCAAWAPGRAKRPRERRRGDPVRRGRASTSARWRRSGPRT